MSFSERLEFLLKTKRLSVEELAEQMGQSVQTIRMWLNSTASPSKGELVKLALILNVKSTYLVGKDSDLLFNDDSHKEKANFDSSAFKQKLNEINQGIHPELKEEQHFKDTIYPEMLLTGLLNNPMISEYVGFDLEDIASESTSEFMQEVLRQIELISWKYRRKPDLYIHSLDDEIEVNK